MRYALLIYAPSEAADREARPIPATVTTLLARPDVTSWARLFPEETATTLRTEGDRTLLTDGPFIDSKEYIAGLVVVEAENLDGALAIAHEMADTRSCGAIEVRPVIDGRFHAA